MRSRSSRVLVLFALSSLASLPLALRQAHAGGVPLAEDARQMKIVLPEIDEAPTGEGVQPPPTEPGKRKITRIELVQVIPLNKNNPLNPIDPINNSGGQITQPIEPKKDKGGGNGGGGEEDEDGGGEDEDEGDDGGDDGGNGGNGGGQENLLDGPNSVAYFNDEPGSFFAHIDYVPETGRWRLNGGPSIVQGIMIGVLVPINPDAAFYGLAGPGVLTGPRGLETGFNTPTTITVKDTVTEKTFEITFTAGPAGTGISDVTVVEVPPGTPLRASSRRAAIGSAKKKVKGITAAKQSAKKSSKTAKSGFTKSSKTAQGRTVSKAKNPKAVTPKVSKATKGAASSPKSSAASKSSAPKTFPGVRKMSK